MPDEYDAHMSHPNVLQTQTLSAITREQFELLPLEVRPSSSAAILGVANGNGLEHVFPSGIGNVVGIDINMAFLDKCHARFTELEDVLELYHLDFINEAEETIKVLASIDLITANLFIKHVHHDNFIKVIAGLPVKKRVISCVIQINQDGNAVSKTGFEHVFDGVSLQREEEDEDRIIKSMNDIGYLLYNRVTYELPNLKQFVRMDFSM